MTGTQSWPTRTVHTGRHAEGDPQGWKPTRLFRQVSARPERLSGGYCVRSLREYRFSRAISLCAAFGARTAVVTMVRFSSVLP